MKAGLVVKRTLVALILVSGLASACGSDADHSSSTTGEPIEVLDPGPPIAVPLPTQASPAPTEPAASPIATPNVSTVTPSPTVEALDNAPSESDAPRRQTMPTVSTGPATLNAGNWYAGLSTVDLGTVGVELELTEDLADFLLVRNHFGYLALQHQSPSRPEPTFFGAQIFPGFAQGVLPDTPTGLTEPLPAVTFLEGIERLVGVKSQGTGRIGGFESVWYLAGEGSAESPFACEPWERPPGLEPDDRCTRFNLDGWTIIDRASDPDYLGHYIEELGVLISYPVVVGGEGEPEPDPAFAPLVEGLTLIADPRG